ncbi:permease-like cell division protein FtsX [Psychrosphaera sp. B3R10]|uniref:permease-like cell division protein FtsX n=1 Tax=unclassified Psychrosphaera TaxID=2641570 RepID=UPI001C08C2AF|nr:MULTISPECIES: permease-like cell division protein FtsX [unclassified Psychrosphaera]MBU2882604.1 permease-like cell division protein FtsX [Psychrosphaera sp. I2R16]MBU2989377.1 permease-like cell division protein FtsX [Psychrosphaera sp. B3R10]
MSILFSSEQKGATNRGVNPLQRFVYFWINNLRQIVTSLGEIWRTPVASVMTILVMGLSLTLPATLHIIVKNVQSINVEWDSASEISLFLNEGLSEQQIASAIRRISAYDEVDELRYISKNDAIEEFKTLSGFGQALSYLESNPLPASFVITPTARFRQAESAKNLLLKLQKEREVDFGKLDIDWLTRLNAIVNMLQESVITVAILLLVSVVLIIGNTIRLSIISRREEIEVMKLVGATEAFIQRPFVYTGLWYGLMGGFIAFIVVNFVVWWMQSALVEISGLYVNDFEIEGLSFAEFGWLMAIASFLGFSGAFWSVHRHIKEIEPNID